LKSDFKFYSKKNTVIFRDGVVEKHVASDEAAAREAAMLARLAAAGVHVPRVIARENQVIKMSYISGETLPDLLGQLESAHCPLPTVHSCADGLIVWLADFYRAAAGEIRGDVNGRNFLWDGTHWWGVDFEARAAGERARDIGRLLAFILTYDPPDTPIKNAFANRLLAQAAKRLNADIAAILHHRDLEFLAMQSRRTHCPLPTAHCPL